MFIPIIIGFTMGGSVERHICLVIAFSLWCKTLIAGTEKYALDLGMLSFCTLLVLRKKRGRNSFTYLFLLQVLLFQCLVLLLCLSTLDIHMLSVKPKMLLAGHLTLKN